MGRSKRGRSKRGKGMRSKRGKRRGVVGNGTVIPER